MNVFLLPTIHGGSGHIVEIETKTLETSGEPICTTCNEEHDFWGDENGGSYSIEFFRVRGLVLKLSGDEPGHFSRVGSFHLRHLACPESQGLNVEVNQHYLHLLSSLKQFGAATAKTVCTEVMPSVEQPELQYKLTIT